MISRTPLAAALAVLVVPLGPVPGTPPPPAGDLIFQGGCATCHAAGSPRVLSGQKLLGDTKSVTGDDPTGAIRLILRGRQPAPEQRGAWMPGFATVLSDQQIADVLQWLRTTSGQPPWPGLTERVHAIRNEGQEAAQ